MDEFEKLFSQVYETSNQKGYMDFHKKRFKNIFLLISKLKVRKILDIGESGFTSILRKEGCDVKVLNKEDCDLEKDNIPYKDNSFDLVIYAEVIEHLRENHLNTLKEIYRVLKPNGFLLFGTPNSKSLRKILFKNQVDFSVHKREFSMKECVKLIKEAKFNIIYSEYGIYLDSIKKTPKFFLYYLIVKIIPGFRECIEILARK